MKQFAVLCLFMLTTAAKPHAKDHDQHFAANEVKQVVIVNGQGEIHLRGTKPAQARVHLHHKTGDKKACEIKSTLHAGILEIRAAKQDCNSDVDVYVPMQVDSHIENTGGNVYVAGVRGKLELRLGKSNAVVGGQLSLLDAHIDQGGMSAQGLTGSANVDMDAGHLQLYFENATETKVWLHLGEGNATLTFPASTTTVAVRTQLTDGRLQNTGLTLSDEAAVLVDGAIGKGDLALRKAGAKAAQ